MNAAAQRQSASATLTYGANSESVDLPPEGITIDQLIERYSQTMNLPEGDRTVMRNGGEARGGDKVQDGDQIEVIREAGSKG